MIRFLFGRPGSGKTAYMIEQIAARTASGEGRVWLIVPEQQVYSAERDILPALPPDAGRRFSILSFSRLSDVVADRFGGRTQHTVTRAMRTLLMWQNLRELSGILETYTTAGTTDAALCRKVLRATEEFQFNAVSPTALEGAASRLGAGSPLHGKLRDLALIGAAYDGLLREVYGENPADALLRAAEKIHAYDFFAGDTVFVDSFSSFTAQEYAVIRPLLEQAAEVTVSFDCASRYDGEPQFERTRESVRRLSRIASDVGCGVEDICLPAASRPSDSELQLLEAYLWAYDRVDLPLPPESGRGQVRLVVAPTAYDEAEAAALHILELHEAGVPYAEIALVARDTAAWEGILDAALEKYSIPFFLSERTDLNEKPAARLVLTALSCVARRWQTEDVITLCKTGLCGVSPRDVDYFAEYVDTWHLGGRRMTDAAWSMNPDGYTTELTERGLTILQAANRVRETIMTPLLALEQDIRTAETVTDECRAIYAYLGRLGIREKLSEEAEENLRLGRVREAGEAVRLWSFLCETLATVASVMEAAEPLSADELCTALSLVFAETDIGSVPARHDCVTVGSAGTLRVDNVRAMLVIGLCEGEFPQSVRDDGLLSEQDKEVLDSLGIELDSRAGLMLSEELLYVWRAMAKPSETLILSHSTTTPDGQGRSPSAVLSRVRQLLPYLRTTAFSSRMIQESDRRHRTPTEDTVSRLTARKLLGEELWLSQTGLQTYARCPYSYYGSRILRLREPIEAKLDNLGAGLFLHHVMEEYLRRALDEENRIRPMEPKEAIELADAIMEAYIREVCGDAARNGRLLHLFDRLRQVALVLIDSIQAELSQSDFRVAGLEWDTHGYRPGDPQPMVLSLTPDMADIPKGPLPTDGTHTPLTDRGVDDPHGLPVPSSPVKIIMGGRIDRVDIYRAADGETVYVRVVDYKSSRHEFTLRSLTENMNIQLMLYLFTLCSEENRALYADRDGVLPRRVMPAAAVYLSPDESDRAGAILPCRTGIALGDPELIEAANRDPNALYLPSVRRDKAGAIVGRGLTSAAEMADLQGILQRTILSTASAMYGGGAGRTPSIEACRFCRLKPFCSVSEG